MAGPSNPAQAKRQKFLIGLLIVVALLAAYMQLSGGDGGETTSPTPTPAPSSQTKPSTGQTGTNTPSQAPDSGVPADPTSPSRPGDSGSVSIIPDVFPGTDAPTISYDPFAAPAPSLSAD